MARLIFLLVALFPLRTFAFSCATGSNVGSRLTVSVINSVSPCAAGTYTLLDSTEYAAFTQAVSDVATLTAAAATNPANQPFDPVLAASFWSFAMTFIIGCWLLAKHSGVIIGFIRHFIRRD